MTSETSISKEIRDALRKAGWRVERVQSGKVKVSGGWMHLAAKGFPDMLVMGSSPNRKCGHGMFGFLESKTPEGDLSDDQIAWHKWARESGFNVAVVRSWQEAISAVKGWQ